MEIRMLFIIDRQITEEVESCCWLSLMTQRAEKSIRSVYFCRFFFAFSLRMCCVLSACIGLLRIRMIRIMVQIIFYLYDKHYFYCRDNHTIYGRLNIAFFSSLFQFQSIWIIPLSCDASKAFAVIAHQKKYAQLSSFWVSQPEIRRYTSNYYNGNQNTRITAAIRWWGCLYLACKERCKHTKISHRTWFLSLISTISRAHVSGEFLCASAGLQLASSHTQQAIQLSV